MPTPSEKEKLAQAIEDLREQVEEVDESVSIEKLESQKSQFASFLDNSRSRIDSIFSGDTALRLRQSMDELQLQLALGKAESKEALEEQKRKLETALHEAEQGYENLKGEASEDFSEWAQEFGSWKEQIQTRMDLARLHFALGKAEARDDLEKGRQDLSRQVSELKAKMDDLGDAGEEKWDAVSNELKESYSHLKSAIKGLFS